MRFFDYAQKRVPTKLALWERGEVADKAKLFAAGGNEPRGTPRRRSG